jgi:hypothetical protein
MATIMGRLIFEADRSASPPLRSPIMVGGGLIRRLAQERGDNRGAVFVLVRSACSGHVEVLPSRGGRMATAVQRREAFALGLSGSLVLRCLGWVVALSCDGQGRSTNEAGGFHRAGPSTSAAHRRRRLDPCKGWPSATASGGFGLDKDLAVDILRCQEIDGQEWVSTRLPAVDPLQTARSQ